MRGYGSLLGSALIASMTVISLAVLAAAASQWAAGVRDLAERAAAFSVPPRMMLEPLGQCNATGWLEAVLKVEPVTSGFKPWAVEIYNAGERKLLYSRFFDVNNTAVVDIPCSGFVELVVIGKNGGVWLYQYELDPSKPCLNGARVNGQELLQNSTSCLTSLNTTGIVTEQVTQEAVREVLLVQYGPVLQPVWAAGPLLPGANPFYAAANGPLPGAYVDPERLRLYTITEWPVRDSREYGETGYVRARCSYGCPPAESELYVYRRVLEPLAGGLFRIEHREAAIHVANSASWVGYKLKAKILAAGLLATDYDKCVFKSIYSPCVPVFSSMDWREGYTVPGRVGGNGYTWASWESLGAAGSIYIPFLITRDSQQETITLLLLPRDPVTAKVHLQCRGFDCPRGIDVVQNMALPATYVSVKLHLLPPNAYDPGKLVVARGLASRVDQTWQARAQEALYTTTILRATRLDHPIVLTLRLSPGLVKRLGPTATAAVAVVEVSYAAKAGRWISKFLYYLGGYLPLGTEFLLYIAHSHTETVKADELLTPASMTITPCKSTRPVGSILLDHKTFGYSKTLVTRFWSSTYYTTYSISYNETLVLRNPSLVLCQVEPGTQVIVEVNPTTVSGEHIELDLTASPVPFPRSIINEVLEEGAKPLILT
ncbi:hypothetical protein [Pyrodictium abyssi]|uniref:Uncharacterized protein n=1 Tax=Pyrodictium abyssi TaxID=54256 RepID=A0ABM8IZ11_9CREN|nr:hypothetical protein PABY_17230 [Pyrodictium abyssi]